MENPNQNLRYLVCGLDTETLDKNETCSLSDETCLKKNKIIQNIIFKTYYGNTLNTVKISSELLSKWRQTSEFLDILLNSYHDSDTYELDFTHIIELSGLMIVFDFLNTGKLQKQCNKKNSEIIKCLAYLGLNNLILNDIKKGFGLVYNLTPLDYSTKNNEKELKNISNREKEQTLSFDESLLLEQDQFDSYYNNFKSNYSTIKKKYGYVNTLNTTFIPENNIQFVKNVFRNRTRGIFDNVPDIIVAGGIISNIFTMNECYSCSDYDVFLLTQDKERALEIVNILYERMNSLKPAHILKTKNTITIYNMNYEVQIITKLYNSITEVLCNFDLDSCCVGYSNGELYGLPRFIRSLAYCGNILDPEKYSSSYFNRLKKYIKRGFSVYIPGLDKKDNDYNNDNFIVKKLKEKNTDICSDYLDTNIMFIKNRNYNNIIQTLEIYHKRNQMMDIFDVSNISLLKNTQSCVQIDEIKDENIVYIDWYNTEIPKYLENYDLYKDMYSSKFFY
jgi:hypothetical protein